MMSTDGERALKNRNEYLDQAVLYQVEHDRWTNKARDADSPQDREQFEGNAADCLHNVKFAQGLASEMQATLEKIRADMTKDRHTSSIEDMLDKAKQQKCRDRDDDLDYGLER